MLDPKEFIVTRKRKKYKFAVFQNNPLCFEVEQWPAGATIDVLELGAGTGLFSVELAKRTPGESFVAVDVKADRLQTGAQAAEAAHLHNIRFLRAHADQLAEHIPKGSLKEIWVTFPDPFPRERQTKHRLTHPHFLALYEAWLARGGALYFKTDATALFDWSLEQLADRGWQIQELSFDLHSSHLPEAYKLETTYERRFREKGLRINFVKAVPPTP